MKRRDKIRTLNMYVVKVDSPDLNVVKKVRQRIQRLSSPGLGWLHRAGTGSQDILVIIITWNS